jgi:hypothetical protein
MAGKRASVFDDDDEGEMDLSTFVPKQSSAPSGPPPEQVRAVSEAMKFPSREATNARAATEPPQGQRRYRTGRNVGFSIRARQQDVNRFNAICDSHTWVQGYTLERALDALERELAQKP